MHTYRLSKSIFLLSIPIFFFASGCFKENKAVVRLKEIYPIIRSNNPDSILPLLDAQSIEYLDELLARQHDFEDLFSLGYSHGVPFSTASFYHGNSVDTMATSYRLELVFVMLSLANTPLFSWDKQPKVLEDQSKCCDPAFVVIAEEVSKNTFITSEIRFTREQGKLLLNLPSLMTVHERLLEQDFKKFRSQYSGTINDSESYESLYFESLSDGTYKSMEEFHYRIQH